MPKTKQQVKCGVRTHTQVCVMLRVTVIHPACQRPCHPCLAGISATLTGRGLPSCQSFPCSLLPASPQTLMGVLSWHGHTDCNFSLVFLGQEALGTSVGLDLCESPEASLRKERESWVEAASAWPECHLEQAGGPSPIITQDVNTGRKFREAAAHGRMIYGDPWEGPSLCPQIAAQWHSAPRNPHT